MKLPNHDKLFTEREISIALNNAVIMSLRPESGIIEEPTMRKLRAYCEALIEPVWEHKEEGLVSPEQLVFVLLSAALMIHQLGVVGTDKLPGVSASRALFKDKK